MRDISFKAKRLDNNEWVTGDLLQVSEKDVQIYNKDCGGSDHPVDPSTVCQFTGLRDKNGKAIYEHDLIKCRTTLSYSDWDEWTLAEVVYIPGSFVLRVGDDEGAETVMSYFVNNSPDNIHSFELIGSKFDRKEEK